MQKEFIFEILETARAIKREFDRRALCHGATGAQWRVLACLVRRGDGQRQVEIAETLDVEPITIGRMIDRLEEAGLVERRADSEDRRVWRIYLTPKAAPVVAEIQKIGDQFRAQMLEGISKAEIDTAQQALAGIRDNLGSSGETAARKVS